jgi:hypothetical protein
MLPLAAGRWPVSFRGGPPASAIVLLGIAAVMSKIVDSGPVTMAGGIAVISAGLLFVTLTVGFVVNFYRKRMLKDQSELQPEQGTSN